MALTYMEVLDLIANYYKTDVPTIEAMFAKYNVDVTNINETFKMLDGTAYSIFYNSDGTVRSYVASGVTENLSSISQEALETAGSINSNVTTKVLEKNTSTLTIPLNTTPNTAGKVTITGGLKTAGNFVLKEVTPAIAATGLGITLGKTIDSALYNANPDFWDSHGMSSLDPDTWGSITAGDDSLGSTLFNLVYGIDNSTGDSQAYLDENAVAYLAYYMQTQGVFSGGQGSGTIDPEIYIPTDITQPLVIYSGQSTFTMKGSKSGVATRQFTSDAKYCVVTHKEGNIGTYNFIFINDSPFNTYDLISKAVYKSNENHTAVSGKTFYSNVYFQLIDTSFTMPYSYTSATRLATESIGTIIYDGTVINPDIEGIGTQEGATTPELDGVTSVADTLDKLKEQYPGLWDNAITQDVVQADGTVTTYVYVPIGSPESTGDTDTQPTTGNQTQDDTKVNPDTSTDTLVDLLTKLLTKTTTPTDINTDTDTGTGNTPSVITPTGSASALYKIYNPTQEQLDSFGAWLWSSDFVDQLLKLFNDPMQAIIGLHKVFCPVPVGGTSNIKVGYLDSGVSSDYVSNQYVTIECGSISLREYFGNVFDYDPFTKVYIYLPFVGIEQLNTGDVMRSTIGVKYHCDVLTGACLAEISVTRDGAGGILYTYTGNCAVEYPVSSGSYMGIVASMASVAGGVVGTIASSGSLAPLAMGAVSGIMNAHTSVQHSGGFSGNSGAMGVKTPYLIITRPQTELANTFPSLDGYPTNYSTTIGSCSGYIEIESVHVENISATDGELSEIEMLLKSGVIV